MAIQLAAAATSQTVHFSMLNCTGRRKHIPYKTTSTGFTVVGELGSGTADSTKFLRGDQTWNPAGGVGSNYEIFLDFGTTAGSFT